MLHIPSPSIHFLLLPRNVQNFAKHIIFFLLGLGPGMGNDHDKKFSQLPVKIRCYHRTIKDFSLFIYIYHSTCCLPKCSVISITHFVMFFLILLFSASSVSWD
ncbi:hypothetical protein RJT34_19259 [Clitoria ternatea]|uniref:Uncharacterized protein n=1 Tax=Clitoria ternatea TaxID=43366 RepID=A0AAN9IQP6_CLITE